MIIQSFIENSILHGFTELTNIEKIINILAVISGDRLIVIIEDNGSGIPVNKGHVIGLGTKITRERIGLLDNNTQLRIESHIDEHHLGTRVTIEIPLKILIV